MPKDMQDDAGERTVPPSPPASPDRSTHDSGASSDQRATDDEQQDATVNNLPALGAIQAVIGAQPVNVYIGVLAGSIEGGTVSAAGQATRPDHGETTAHPGVTHWPIPKEELDRLGKVFVAVPSVVEPATKILASQHLVVLQGRAQWGKSTTAQWLLSYHLHHDRIVIVDTGDISALGDLTGTLNGDGYVLDTLVPEHASQLRPATLLRVSNHLRASEPAGHLVITVDALTSLPPDLADYRVVCEQLPDANRVLRRHLVRDMGAKNASQALDLASEWVMEHQRNLPPPGRMRDLAEALATLVRSGGQMEAAEQDYQRRTLAHVAEWFHQHPDLRERCFMTAGAVLNGVSYEQVSMAADRLERLIGGEAAVDVPIPRGWSPVSSRVKRVESIGARLRKATHGSPDGPLALVELEEPLVQPMVLAHLWNEHVDISHHLFTWLDNLARDPDLDFEVSGRGAAAAGTLCAMDFDYLERTLLQPWATESPVRISAPLALTTAAREPSLAPSVLGLLQRWSVAVSTTRLPWIAATTFGLLGSERFLADSLKGLRTITERHHMMSWVVARSLTNLCEAGYTPAALAELHRWLYEPSPELARRARAVVNRLTRLRVIHPDGSLGMPGLLSLTAAQAKAAHTVRHFWYALLDSPRSELRAEARRALRDWLSQADARPTGDPDEPYDDAIGALLYPLLDNPATRRRTRSTLRRCAFDPERRSRTAAHLLRTTAKPLETVVEWLVSVWSSWRLWFR